MTSMGWKPRYLLPSRTKNAVGENMGQWRKMVMGLAERARMRSKDGVREGVCGVCAKSPKVRRALGRERSRRHLGGEAPGDLEDTFVEIAELLEERRAHVYGVDCQNDDIDGPSIEKRTDVVGPAAHALIADGGLGGLAVRSVLDGDLLLEKAVSGLDSRTDERKDAYVVAVFAAVVDVVGDRDDLVTILVGIAASAEANLEPSTLYTQTWSAPRDLTMRRAENVHGQSASA